MTGLDKMKSQILDEAKALADSKIDSAKAKACDIIRDAKAEAEKASESISQKSQADVSNYKERVVSSIDLQKRTKVLETKQEVIAQVIDKAYDSLKVMDSSEYFSMLMKMVEKYTLPQEGEIFLSPNDLGRMPSGFEAEVSEAAKAKGGALTISKEGRNIENGFVLAYGGIEENCTLKAMLDAKKDELSDKVHHLLFS